MKKCINIVLIVLVSVFYGSIYAAQPPHIIEKVDLSFFNDNLKNKNLNKEIEEEQDEEGERYLTAADLAVYQYEKLGISDAEIAENTMAENMGHRSSEQREVSLPIKGLTVNRLRAMTDEQFSLFSTLIDSQTGQLMPFVGANIVRSASVSCSNGLCQRIVEPQEVADCGWQSLKNAHEELSEVYRVEAKKFIPDGKVFHSAQELSVLWKTEQYGKIGDVEIPLFMVTADLIPANEDDQMRLIENEDGLKNAYLVEIKTHLFENEKSACAILMHTGNLGTRSGNDHWIIITVVNTGKKIYSVVMDSIGFRNTTELNLKVFDSSLKGSVFNYKRLNYEPIERLLRELGL